MKIQFLNGGLANQAFQYIFARYYELAFPGEHMYMDDTYFALNTVHNGYELEKVFGIRPHMLSQCFDDEVWNFILDERRKGKSVPTILCENGIKTYMICEGGGDSFRNFNPFDGEIRKIPVNQYIPQILTAEGDVYYHGYWINKNWFEEYKEVFLREFTFPDIQDEINRERLKMIQESNSVSIHVRRGDYVNIGAAYTPEQYKVLVDFFLQNCGAEWDLFVFSDDIEWCRENAVHMGFENFNTVHYVDGNMNGRNYIDMQLMSQCQAMIMSGSAFCYLAVLLNTRRKFAVNQTAREV